MFCENSWAIFLKHTILDVWQGSEHTSGYVFSLILLCKEFQ